ncbi:hypothetical protein GTQ34_08305 [Muricauda sp. JGD-17]|uniref:DUF1579 domain-containing protein n=1 Tax=Flagellimonas ochracea TaxID=2696472 RepID=A0A964TBP0_9FLAO|nr:hypothetical protein [Allomuricauda ochracea]NAY91917.1 hypothetical protein [Allomuricauda ochracea]
MINSFFKSTSLTLLILLCSARLVAQEKSVQDLEFLIGTWQVREDIKDRNWWEESTRIANYTLDSTFIEIDASSRSSTGKERTYRWFIHLNDKTQQFEMVSMFSNWHKVQFDLLDWNPETRKLTIRHAPDPSSEEYHERFGEMIFSDDFSSYEWKGENKYGDPDDPGIWRYVEKGVRAQE